jgi:iron uptake system EfeUOB component EfeO/EfeM
MAAAATTVILGAGLEGPSAKAADLGDKIQAYRQFGLQDLRTVISGVDTLVERLDARDFDGARRAWIDARVGWERSETFVGELFPDSDGAIDAWPDAGKGFHAVEAHLFGADPEAAVPLARQLQIDAQALGARLEAAPFEAQTLLNGLAGLAYEVGEEKSGGAESRISGTSLNDMRNNIAGVETLYEMVFRDAVAGADGKLADRVHEGIEEVEGMLKVDSIARLDSKKVEVASERLAADIMEMAAPLGLKPPSLEE